MTFWIGALITLVIVCLSVGGLVVARHLHRKTAQDPQHDIADPYSQFVAMLFAVLLGFMVADAMQRFGDARATVQQEASSLGNVYRLAEGLADVQRDKVRTLCRDYADTVINDEWPRLSQKEDSAKAWEVYRHLWSACTTYEPVSQRQSNAQQSLLAAMQTVGDNRRLRVEGLHTGLPGELWAVLILGGAATIVFTYFFNAINGKIQLLMVAIVSLVICLNLFLLATYDDPFSGDIRIRPTAFETQLKLYNIDSKEAARQRKDGPQ